MKGGRDNGAGAVGVVVVFCYHVLSIHIGFPSTRDTTKPTAETVVRQIKGCHPCKVTQGGRDFPCRGTSESRYCQERAGEGGARAGRVVSIVIAHVSTEA